MAIAAHGGSVSFLITAKDMASRTIRGVGREFQWLALQARLAEQRMTRSFWRGSSEFKLWARVILLTLPLIPPAMAAVGHAAAGMVSALISIGPGVAAMAASLIGNFKQIKKAAGIGDVKDSWKGFLADTRPTALRALTAAFRTLSALLPRMVPVANAFNRVFATWLENIDRAVRGGALDGFLKWVRTVGAANFGSFLRGMESFAAGLGKLAMSFSSAGTSFSQWFERTMQRFEDWAGSLSGSNGLKKFMDYFRKTWPSVKEMFRQFGRAVGNIMEAVAPFGAPMADGLARFFRIIADADPGHIRRVIGALLLFRAVNAAISGAAWALNGFNFALGRYSKKSDEASGKHAKNQKGFAAVGRGARAARLGILGATLAIGGWVSSVVHSDKEVGRAWDRMARQAGKLWDYIKAEWGPGMKKATISTFNFIADSMAVARRELPKWRQGMQAFASLTLLAIQKVLQGFGKLFEAIARGASKVAMLNPVMATIARGMAGAAAKAYGLARAIGGLRSKSITVTTNFVRNHSINVHTNYTSSGKLGRQGQEIITGYATGGRPPVGRPALVGEKGPELFIPDRPGTVIPNDRTENILNGTDKTLAKVVAKELAKALNGATIRLVDSDGGGRRAYLLAGGNI